MSDHEAGQQATLRFLKDELGPGATEERTHISAVLLGPDVVWKLKRAVTLPYLDFAAAETRLAVCERELALNRRTAPTLYRAVRRVTRGVDGLEFDGQGELVDAVVEMARFPSDDLLGRMADRQALTSSIITRLANAIAEFHKTAAPVSSGSGAARMTRVVEGTAVAFKAAGVFAVEDVRSYDDLCRKALDRHAGLLDDRARSGAVLRGHGDLHLQNVCMWQGEPTMFDCLEFDDELATTDRLYDLAFLLMDLWGRDLRVFANLALNRYLDQTDDEAALGLMPFFMSVRAAIRAHIAAGRALDDAAKAREARVYFKLAIDLLEPASPRLVAIGGFSGSGKSTIAGLIGQGVGPPPGARVLGSDRIRKALFGSAPNAKLPASGYLSNVTSNVYGQISERAERVLRAGHGVVAEATFATEAERARIEKAASSVDVPFHGIWLDVDEHILEARILSRIGDVSDADVGVLHSQIRSGTGNIMWSKINASGAALDVARAVSQRTRRRSS